MFYGGSWRGCIKSASEPNNSCTGTDGWDCDVVSDWVNFHNDLIVFQ